MHSGERGHRLATTFYCVSLVIHVSFYTLFEQFSMHYQKCLFILAHFYTLLLVAGDAASLIAEDLHATSREAISSGGS
jgi:hypothetical protein